MKWFLQTYIPCVLVGSQMHVGEHKEHTLHMSLKDIRTELNRQQR